MRLIIAGSRIFAQSDRSGRDAYDEVCCAMEALANFYGVSPQEISVVISGHAKGIDRAGEHYALVHDIPVKVMMPEWGRCGKRAGLIRNDTMLEQADTLVAIWDGKSRGTRYTIQRAMDAGKKVFVFTVDDWIPAKPRREQGHVSYPILPIS